MHLAPSFTNQRAVSANADERIRVRIAHPTPAGAVAALLGGWEGCCFMQMDRGRPLRRAAKIRLIAGLTVDVLFVEKFYTSHLLSLSIYCF